MIIFKCMNMPKHLEQCLTHISVTQVFKKRGINIKIVVAK